jgi:hypothetical protein
MILYHGRMAKKLFSAFFLAAFLFAGLAGALSIVPHVHGQDTDHSEHQDCALYQLSLSHFEAEAVLGSLPACVFLALWSVFLRPRSSSSHVRFFIPGRAPPTSF